MQLGTYIIIGRKEPYTYADGIRPANGFDIFNMATGMMITRSRCDIRKYRKIKEEYELIKQAIIIGNKMKKAWERSEWHPVGFREQPDFFYEEQQKDALPGEARLRRSPVMQHADTPEEATNPTTVTTEIPETTDLPTPNHPPTRPNSGSNITRNTGKNYNGTQ